MRGKALKLLRNPCFFGEIRNALRRQGLVAQFNSATLTYIGAASALLDDPLTILLAGPTSADTNFLARQVLRLVPPEAICEIPCTAGDALAHSNDSCEKKILYLHDASNGTGSAQFVLDRKGLLAQNVENYKESKRPVTLRIANGPFATIATSTESLRIDAGVPYVSGWVGSMAQQKPALNESVPKQSALSDRELGIWHEAFRLLAERCSYLVILPYFLDMILDLMPRDSFTARNFAVLTKTVGISAVIRSFQSAAYPTKIPKTAYLCFADFEDYAIAATLLNAVFAEAHQREQIDGKKRKAVATKSHEIDAGGIARANRTAKNGHKLVQAHPLESQFFPSPEDLIKETSWVRRPIEFVHPLTGERVTLYPRKRKRA